MLPQTKKKVRFILALILIFSGIGGLSSAIPTLLRDYNNTVLVFTIVFLIYLTVGGNEVLPYLTKKNGK